MLSDELIEEKISLEVMWSWFGYNFELISIMKTTWQRISPGKDTIPYDLKPVNQDPHIYFESECLVYEDECFPEVSLECTAFLYSEEQLAIAGEGPSACPDDFKDLDSKRFSITDNLSDDVESALLRYFTDAPELLMCVIEYKDNPEGFIKSIQNNKLRKKVKMWWKKYSD